MFPMVLYAAQRSDTTVVPGRMNCCMMGRRVAAFLCGTATRNPSLVVVSMPPKPTAAALVVVRRCVFCGRTHSRRSGPPHRLRQYGQGSVESARRRCHEESSANRRKCARAIASSRLAFRKEKLLKGPVANNSSTDRMFRWLPSKKDPDRIDNVLLHGLPHRQRNSLLLPGPA